MVLHCLFSPIFCWGQICLHVTAAIAVLFTELWLVSTLALWVAITLSAVALLQDYGPFSRMRIEECHIAPDHALLVSRSRRWRAALPQVLFISEFLILLRFHIEEADCDRASKGCKYLVLVPDSLSEADNCRLRRYLYFDCIP